MKKIFFIITILFCCNITFAQISVDRQVIGSTGNLTNTGAILASSNVGETAISTFSQTTLVLTQGFEQPDTIMITGIIVANMSAINISVYPNPATDNITILIAEKAIIEILNIEGQIIRTINNISQEAIIDLMNLSSGIYLIKATSDKVISVKKFIKE